MTHVTGDSTVGTNIEDEVEEESRLGSRGILGECKRERRPVSWSCSATSDERGGVWSLSICDFSFSQSGTSSNSLRIRTLNSSEPVISNEGKRSLLDLLESLVSVWEELSVLERVREDICKEESLLDLVSGVEFT